MLDEDIRKFKPFISLVVLSRKRQHNYITYRQYSKLLSLYLKTRPMTSPLFGWFYKNRHQLFSSLINIGIRIKSEESEIINELHAKDSGFKWIAEVEKRIRQV